MIWMVGIIAAFGAMALGQRVANGDYKPIIFAVTATVAMTIGLSVGKNYWLLIPMTFSAVGSIGALPLPVNYAELGIIGAFGLFILHACFKQESIGFKSGLCDKLIIVNAIWLIILFVRNPVGFNALGSDMVGGRPYFSILFVLIGYIVVSHGRMTGKMASWFTAAMAFGMFLPAALVTVSELVPGISKVIYPFYSGVSIDAFRVGPMSEGNSSTRIFSLQEVCRPIVLALCAYFPPVTLINPLYMGRCLAFFVALAMGGMSGFRSLFLAIAGYMAIGTLVRKRFADLYVLGFVGMVGVIVLLLAHMGGAPVPVQIQRALAFLPLDWDPEATRGAEATVEWRTDMWRDAWEDKQIIKNKFLGDGFGFRRSDLLLFSDELLGIGGVISTGNTYETFMIRGSFHNGPLSTIRFGGFVGLILVTWLLFAVFSYALRTINKSKGSPYYVLSIFVSLPILYEPFQFFVIIGSYENLMTTLLFGTGMLNMINFSLEQWMAEKTSSETESQIEERSQELVSA